MPSSLRLNGAYIYRTIVNLLQIRLLCVFSVIVTVLFVLISCVKHLQLEKN